MVSSIPSSRLDELVTLYKGHFDHRTIKAPRRTRVIPWQTPSDLVRELSVEGYTSILARLLEGQSASSVRGKSRRRTSKFYYICISIRR